MARTGRPSKLTDTIKRRILEVISVGGTITLASKYAGVSRQTIHDWIARGEKQKKGIYRDFLDEFRRAEARPEVFAMGMIQRAIQSGDLASAKWYLEKRVGWGKTEETPVQISISHEQLSVKQLLIEAGEASKTLEAVSLPVIDLDEE
jgi:transposase